MKLYKNPHLTMGKGQNVQKNGKKREFSFNLPIPNDTSFFGKKIPQRKSRQRYTSEKKDLPSIKAIKFSTPLNQSLSKKKNLKRSSDLSSSSLISKKNKSENKYKRNKTNKNKSFTNIMNLSFSNDFVNITKDKLPNLNTKTKYTKTKTKIPTNNIYNNTLSKSCLKTLSGFDIIDKNNNSNLSFGNENNSSADKKKKHSIDKKSNIKMKNRNTNNKKIFWLNSNKNLYTSPIYFHTSNNNNNKQNKIIKTKFTKIKSRKEILSSLLHTNTLESNNIKRKISNVLHSKPKIPFQYKHQNTTVNKSVDLNSTFKPLKRERIKSFQNDEDLSKDESSELTTNSLLLPNKNTISLHNLFTNNKSCTSLLLTPPPMKSKLPPLSYLSSPHTNYLNIRILSFYNEDKTIHIKKLTLYDTNNSKIDIPFISYNINNNDNNNYFNIYYRKAKANDIKAIVFNKEDKDESMGIKEIEIYSNKNKIFLWRGTIPKNEKEYKINIHNTTIELFSSDNEDNDNCNITLKTFNKIRKKQTSGAEIVSKLELIDHNIISSCNTRSNITSSNDYYKTVTSFHKQNTVSNKMLSNYIKCRKIKIVLICNYGHKKHIGLTGLELLTKNNTVIDIETASSIGALPKNLKHSKLYSNQIFENLFNNTNQTINEDMMWLTNNIHPYIEISFPLPIFLSGIRIWNYNNPNSLDKGSKQIEIYIDEIYNCAPILRKGIGDDIIDYSQLISFPYIRKDYSKEEIEPFKQIKYASMLYNQRYETPYLPTGMVFQFVLLSSWSGTQSDIITVEEIKMYDQLGREVTAAYKSNMKRKGYCEEFFNYKKHYDFYENDTFRDGFIDPNPNMTNINMKKQNTIYFLYDKPISLSYIRILNNKKEIEKSVSKMIIKCDDNIIFDGEINKYNKSNNGYTSILFTCDLNITKDIKENELSGYENEMKNQLSNIYLYTNSSEGDDQSERGMYKTVKYEGGIMMIIN